MEEVRARRSVHDAGDLGCTLSCPAMPAIAAPGRLAGGPDERGEENRGMTTGRAQAQAAPGMGEALATWARIGLLSFGRTGPGRSR